MVFAAVFAPLLAIYALVPNPGRPTMGHHADALTNTVTAAHLGVRGTVVLDGFQKATAPEYFSNIGWYLDSPRGPVSQYPPGAAAFAAPLYWLTGDPLRAKQMSGTNNPQAPPLYLAVPSVDPATAAASIAVASAMGFVALAVFGATGQPGLAVGTGYIGGIATPMWPVAASALWPHGPGAMWVALAVLMAAKERYLLSGFGFGAAVLTRPHLAFVGAAIGTYVAWKERRTRHMLLVGGGAAVGLTGLLVFNWWLWGAPSVSGGYSSDFAHKLVSLDIPGYAVNIVGAFVDPLRGVFVVTPFLVPLLLYIRLAWADAPDWVRGAALGGVLYLLIQLKANRYSGGGGFVGYRYPLEPLVACGPLLAMAYPHWTRGSTVKRWGFWTLVVGSIVIFFLWSGGRP